MHKIEIVPTANEAIVKFESSQFLVKNNSYEFKNIDEAKPSPLAQQLFYLPFVKTVYIAQNFIAIERYDIVQWNDVQQEVATQIETYLNSDKPLLTEESKTKKIPVTVYAESTPNPNAMKFVANKKLVVKPIEFKSIGDTQTGSLARKLFEFSFVKELYVSENYISILKHDIIDWNEVSNELRSMIKESMENGLEIGTSNHESKAIEKSKEPEENQKVFENLDDISQKIVEILDEYIKPAVAGDGGNIAFENYNENTKEVSVILQGACSGCPSSTITLKNGIETMLKEMIPGKIDRVVALNG